MAPQSFRELPRTALGDRGAFRVLSRIATGLRACAGSQITVQVVALFRRDIITISVQPRIRNDRAEGSHTVIGPDARLRGGRCGCRAAPAIGCPARRIPGYSRAGGLHPVFGIPRIMEGRLERDSIPGDTPTGPSRCSQKPRPAAKGGRRGSVRGGGYYLRRGARPLAPQRSARLLKGNG